MRQPQGRWLLQTVSRLEDKLTLGRREHRSGSLLATELIPAARTVSLDAVVRGDREADTMGWMHASSLSHVGREAEELAP